MLLEFSHATSRRLGGFSLTQPISLTWFVINAKACMIQTAQELASSLAACGRTAHRNGKGADALQPEAVVPLRTVAARGFQPSKRVLLLSDDGKRPGRRECKELSSDGERRFRGIVATVD